MYDEKYIQKLANSAYIAHNINKSIKCLKELKKIMLSDKVDLKLAYFYFYEATGYISTVSKSLKILKKIILSQAQSNEQTNK